MWDNYILENILTVPAWDKGGFLMNNGTSPIADFVDGSLRQVSIKDIFPEAIKATNIRKGFDLEEFEMLKASIKNEGQQTPIKLRKLEPDEIKKLPDLTDVNRTEYWGILEGHQRYTIFKNLYEEAVKSENKEDQTRYYIIQALISTEKNNYATERKAALMSNIAKVHMTWEERASLIYELYCNTKETDKDTSIRKFTDKIEKDIKLSKSTVARMVAYAKQELEVNNNPTTTKKPEKGIFSADEVESKLDKLFIDKIINYESANIEDKQKTVDDLKKLNKNLAAQIKTIQDNIDSEKRKAKVKAKEAKKAKVGQEKN